MIEVKHGKDGIGMGAQDAKDPNSATEAAGDAKAPRQTKEAKDPKHDNTNDEKGTSGIKMAEGPQAAKAGSLWQMRHSWG